MISAGSPAPRTVFLRIVVICLAIRVVLQLLGMISVAADGQPAAERAIGMWSQWDAPHYLRIAEVGYVSGEPVPPECLRADRPVHPCDDHLFIVFFPFFPAAVALVGVVVRNLIVSGLLVSLAASIGACWFLYRLVDRDDGHDKAWRAVLLFLSFPTAYYLSAPYSEALFLFGVVTTMYLARSERWPAAGFAGALATGTRVTGLALFPALLAEAFSKKEQPADVRVRRVASIAVAGAGVAVYLLINQIVHGDPFHFLDVQRSHWFQYSVPPWRPIVDAVSAVTGPNSPTETFIYWGRITGVAFAVPVLLSGMRRLRLADSVYAWSGLLLMLCASWLISLPRYLLVLYPIFMIGAEVIRSRRAMAVAVTAGASIQGWLFWRYAAGAWTF